MDSYLDTPTRGNIVTVFNGLALDWRIQRIDPETLDVELITRCQLTVDEYEEAENEAIAEYEND